MCNLKLLLLIYTALQPIKLLLCWSPGEGVLGETKSVNSCWVKHWKKNIDPPLRLTVQLQEHRKEVLFERIIRETQNPLSVHSEDDARGLGWLPPLSDHAGKKTERGLYAVGTPISGLQVPLPTLLHTSQWKRRWWCSERVRLPMTQARSRFPNAW